MGLLDFLKPREKTAGVHEAYLSIVKQARRPELYAPGCAPDNFDGRFDMMALHVHLVLRRLRALGMGRSQIGQDLFDMFFKDMDQAMREAGVGDMGVGKKVQKMVEAFYGRATAYDGVLDAQGEISGIYDILARNLYPETAPSPQQEAGLNALSGYALALEKHLADVPLEDILNGHSFTKAPNLKVTHG
ncbi:MAG TPA: ubiquinol-cytochrome C chaperone [Rhodobiaceae bacterium]|jgi:cytochrome b pre-mRNA-processing protein 3|nr:ubiquinol-cytochrome C chaperone [Rhodobiaceae bacterium]|tara:strand:- start:25 stop:591 length:567 start_codon:yes stop_codon:yes gene_type:complete